MRVINFNDQQELIDSYGKKCQIEFQAVGFPSEVVTGTLLRAEFNTKVPSFRIVVEIDGVGLAIPANHILTLSVEE
ncbi:hypothetical protein [Bacteroides cellulosilyticus]|jgi:hypothetical protein|uniref:hypothetical protein n=1 Tax=Bacteroides cellulosilyticus TaxID=246787 RepID=UPI001D066636|nr:hypothetical protein [Bacteroides cellulosilyticus]MCB6590880.1 hypothetical protein [Bacteroides cellulosilyticus]